MEWFLRKKKRKKWPSFGRVIKKIVVQVFDVLGKKKKKKNTVIKNQKCSKWLLYILLVSYPS